MTALIIVLVLVIAVHLWRQHFLNRATQSIPQSAFEGKLYRVGETTIAVRAGTSEPAKTVICFPGFTETQRYFLPQYEHTDYELILFNNAAYHCPFNAPRMEGLDWPENPHEVGTVEYDGFYLAQAVKSLASSDNIVIHGHSRGGAVTLDAGRQFPEVMKADGRHVTALLECAAVPQGTAVSASDNHLVHAITRYVIPFFFMMMRGISKERLEKMPMMQPTNPIKTGLVMEHFNTPKAYHVFMTNMENLINWQKGSSTALYENFPSVKVVMGERDDVLVNDTMKASAEEGQAKNAGVEIIATSNTNHFVGVEEPHYIQELVAKA